MIPQVNIAINFQFTFDIKIIRAVRIRQTVGIRIARCVKSTIPYAHIRITDIQAGLRRHGPDPQAIAAGDQHVPVDRRIGRHHQTVIDRLTPLHQRTAVDRHVRRHCQTVTQHH